MTTITNQSTRDAVQRLTERPLDAEEVDIKQLRAVIRTADAAYYLEGAPILSDEVYDVILAIYRKKRKEGGEQYDAGVGFAQLPPAEQERPFPFPIGSTNKYVVGETNLDRKFSRWVSKHAGTSVTLSHKLNGVSALYYHWPTHVDGQPDVTLQSRQGHPLTRLIPYLGGLPAIPPGHGVRGEIIMPDDAYRMHYGMKDASGGYVVNALALVSGMTDHRSHQLPEHKLRRMHFVAYEYIDGGASVQTMTHHEQLERLRSLGFRTVQYKTVSSQQLSIDGLREHYKTSKLTTEYDIDGVVVTQDGVPNDRSNTDSTGNPRYAMAFKENPNGVLVRVNSVEWDISRTGRFIPVVHFDPVFLGSEVQKATAHNAAFVRDNALGPGAQVRVIKAGTVIPKIASVVSGVEAVTYPTEDHMWDENKTHLVYPTGTEFVCQVPDEELPDRMRVKILHYFLKTLGVKFAALQNVKRLFQASLVTHPHHFLTLTPAMILKADVEGFKRRSAERLCTQVQDKLRTATTLSTFAIASGRIADCIGTRTLQKVLDNIPCRTIMMGCYGVTNDGDSETFRAALVPLAEAVPSIGPSHADAIAKTWPIFVGWCTAHVPSTILDAVIGNSTPGKNAEGSADGGDTKKRDRDDKDALDAAFAKPYVLLTGGKNKEIVAFLGKSRTAGAWSGKVTLLVVKDGSVSNAKTKKAAKAGVPVMTQLEFIAAYM